MFSHYRLYDSSYFKIIRQADNFIEITPLNTKHCWIILGKEYCSDNKRYILYHKHNLNDQYYHVHNKVSSVSNAVSKIRYHDFNTINRLNHEKKKTAN